MYFLRSNLILFSVIIAVAFLFLAQPLLAQDENPPAESDDDITMEDVSPIPVPEAPVKPAAEAEEAEKAAEEITEEPEEASAEIPISGEPEGAILQGLNKVTARVSKLKLEIGKTSNFGNLEIELLNCWKSPPEESPEAAALMKIAEKRPTEKSSSQIYYGWMFASSPALAALEHAVYDITVLDCY